MASCHEPDSIQGMNELDYKKVSRYWTAARPSILGPYMMEGFGFPTGAGQYRFDAETGIVRRLTRGLDDNGSVLDLGSGIGCWTEHFARRFGSVVSVEASPTLYQTMKRRCAPYPNVLAVHSDVLRFEPHGAFELVFLGGLLMYLNESDVVNLLRKVLPSLKPEGAILCRETTVRKGIVTRRGDYQAVYRSVAIYEQIFDTCGLYVVQTQLNVPYVLMQMGCELVRNWKRVLPFKLQFTPAVGHLLYWALRMGTPWITRAPGAFGLDFPELTNHFFLIRPNQDHLS